jgi:hypothetical protein
MNTRQIQSVNTIGLPVNPVHQPVATKSGDFTGKETAHEITVLLSECDAGVSR